MKAIRKGFNAVNKAFTALCNCFDYLAGILIFFCVIFTAINVCARVIFKSPFSGAIEVISYSMYTAVCLAIAPCNAKRGHITVDLLTEILPAKVTDALDVLTGLVCTTGFFYFGRYMIKVAGQRAAKGEVLAITKAPVSIFYWILGIGLMVLALSTLFNSIDSFLKIFEKAEPQQENN